MVTGNGSVGRSELQEARERLTMETEGRKKREKESQGKTKIDRNRKPNREKERRKGGREK